jgi:hypothetical protein
VGRKLGLALPLALPVRQPAGPLELLVGRNLAATGRSARAVIDRPVVRRHLLWRQILVLGLAVAKQLSEFMGHANIGITLDRYGHLFPGAEGEAARALDAYLDRTISG